MNHKTLTSTAEYLSDSGVVIPKWEIGTELYVPNMKYVGKNKEDFVWTTRKVVVDEYVVKKSGSVKFLEYHLLLNSEEVNNCEAGKEYRTAFENSTNIFEKESECERFVTWMNKNKEK